ncbi:MAG: hypothetical protein PF437_08155 [Sulfurimonas sp.]|jgi:hypothetical protein|nr:hypothetical protein [Sulfurimonas sp.]
MKKFNLATLLLGAMLFLGLGATTASAAEAMKCGAGKCGSSMKKDTAKCGGEKKAAAKCGAEKKDAAKCGGEKKDEKKAMKCGSGKCGSK